MLQNVSGSLISTTNRKESNTMSKINLPIAELKPALTGLGKIISKRSTLPTLGCIKVDRTKEG
ncbi:MAG: hypothetical protein QOD99_2003 [Chthoniobacter sp.]|jgi:hypothetical protein|nr:hypothetical protein [Chthoniobacter sp.]